MKNSDSPSLQPYKGTRDFYPENKRLQKQLFGSLRKTVESFGYEEYDAPILEETALYTAKTGEEIVNEQTYSFTDRGGRNVSLRPEMTPTLARMVAQKRNELTYPLRWYSLPNLWRYERPQRGRLREHWQLNVDMYGINSIAADFEIISIAAQILIDFGATPEMARIKINNRRLTNNLLFNILKTGEATAYKIIKLIDGQNKMEKDEFLSLLENHLNKNDAAALDRFISEKNLGNLFLLFPVLAESQGGTELKQLFHLIDQSHLKDWCEFDPSIVRGFDYYTGTVFEVFDQSDKNSRSLFGGGRYDKLLSIFNVKDLSGVGFGMGDVTLKDFLETHKILRLAEKSEIMYVTVFNEHTRDYSQSVALKLREAGYNTILETENLSLEKQLKHADKKNLRFCLIAGPDEIKNSEVLIKDLEKHTQTKVPLAEITSKIK